MANVSYSWVWNYRKNKVKAGDSAPIHLKIYFERDIRRFIDTGVEISEAYWDGSYIRTKHPNYNNIHNRLRDLRGRIEEYEQKLISNKQSLTPEALKRYLSGKINDPNSFLEFFLQEMENDNTIDIATVKGHKTTYSQLVEYSSGHLSFDDLDYEWVVKFDRWMRNRGLGPNTIHKRHQIVARYYRAAERYRKVPKGKNPYDDFQAKKIEGSRVGLTEEELVRLENLDRTGMDESTVQVLDRFLFSCYTGLRISDSISLLRSEVADTPDGLIITKKMVKTDSVTGGSVTLPLRMLFAGKPEKLAQKYMEEFPDTNHVFPLMADPTINRILKVISQMAKLQTPLTFHTRRHSILPFQLKTSKLQDRFL